MKGRLDIKKKIQKTNHGKSKKFLPLQVRFFTFSIKKRSSHAKEWRS
jgi:hypothetical protein